MGRRLPLTTMKPLSEINLTPLMDLTFILLITFIITFPLIEQGVPIKLPQGAATPLPSDVDRAVITLDDAGNLYFDDRPVTFESLLSQCVVLAETAPTTAVYIRADETVPYGDVVKVLRALHERKLTRIALVTRDES
jgi:biopolymer transport protein TolR